MNSDKIRKFKDRLRIFSILYSFSEPCKIKEKPHLKRLFKSEVRIQKIDFLLRNPDYLSYEILQLTKTGKIDKIEAGKVVSQIFDTEEPVIRKLEMQRLFYGAYEEIDDAIAFLTSVGFIEFESKKNTRLSTIEKYYFITELALEKAEANIGNFEYLNWYFERCSLIKKYFGSLSGSELKDSQYEIPEYKNTPFKEYIKGIESKVRKEYFQLYGDRL